MVLTIHHENRSIKETFCLFRCYDIPIEEIRQVVKDIDNSPPSNDTPHISDDLRESTGLQKLENGPISRNDWENSKQEFLEEIRILLSLDKYMRDVRIN